MPTPNIIFRLEYNTPYSAGTPKSTLTTRRDFVACKGGHNLYNYLTRPSASDKSDIETIKIAEQLADNTSISEADLLSYANNRPGSTGAFNRDGDLTPEKASEIKSELRNTESIIWTAVLSFEEGYGKERCNNKAVAQELVKKTLPELFKNTKLNYDNIEWYGALHENTDHRHIHLCFWEKEPTFLRKGDTEYHFASPQYEKITSKDCDNFKFAVAKYFDVENMSSYQNRDALRKDFRKNINTERKKSALETLLDGVKGGNSWQFGRQSKEVQDKIITFAMNVIQSDKALNEQYNSYIKEVQAQQQKYFDVCRKNNLQVTKEIKEFAEKNINDLHTRLGNDVMQALKYYDAELEKEKIKKLSMGKKTINKKNSKIKITGATIFARNVGKIFNKALNLCNTSMGGSINAFRNAIKEQERRRQQAEGVTYE